jgi:hypothetical protein
MHQKFSISESYETYSIQAADASRYHEKFLCTCLGARKRDAVKCKPCVVVVQPVTESHGDAAREAL